MKKALIISSVMGVLLIAFLFIKGRIQLMNERELFAGMTKQEFIKKLTSAFKDEYFLGMRNWLNYDNNLDPNWITDLSSKAKDAGVTYEAQLERTINYMWKTQDQPLIDSKNPNKWTNRFAKEFTQNLGIDFSNKKVKAAIKTIQSKN